MPGHTKIAGRLTGPSFAMGSMLSSQLGSAIAVPLMVAHGSFGISAMRLVCAACFTLVLVRPNFMAFNGRQWRGAIALGIVMAFMTMCYFTAIAKIPVGPAITIDFLGPLSIAILALRGWPRFLFPLLAGTGILTMTFGEHGWLFAPVGVLFALGAACGWAGYILLMRHVGQLFSEQEGLCLSFIVAAIAAMPVAIAYDPPEQWLHLIPAIAGLTVLSPLLPFMLEMMALRRMHMGTFSIFMSLEPAIGAILGFIVLNQTLLPRQLLGVLAVMAASTGAVILSPARQPDGQTLPVPLSPEPLPVIGGVASHEAGRSPCTLASE